MNKSIHIPEPRFSILIIKIIAHCPHYVVRMRNICLINKNIRSQIQVSVQNLLPNWLSNEKLLQQMKFYLCYGCRNKINNTLLNIVVKQKQVILPMIVDQYKMCESFCQELEIIETDCLKPYT